MNLRTNLPSIEVALNGGDSGECRNSSSIRDPSQLGTLYTPNNETERERLFCNHCHPWRRIWEEGMGNGWGNVTQHMQLEIKGLIMIFIAHIGFKKSFKKIDLKKTMTDYERMLLSINSSVTSYPIYSDESPLHISCPV